MQGKDFIDMCDVMAEPGGKAERLKKHAVSLVWILVLLVICAFSMKYLLA